MMRNTTGPLIQKAIWTSLQAEGFTRARRSLFVRAADEIVWVARLEKSPFGRQYWLSVGFWLPGVPSPHELQDGGWHLESRWPVRNSQDEATWNSLLNGDTSISAVERDDQIRKRVKEEIIPFFAEFPCAESAFEYAKAVLDWESGEVEEPPDSLYMGMRPTGGFYWAVVRRYGLSHVEFE